MLREASYKVSASLQWDFLLTGVPVAMLMEGSDGSKMGKGRERDVKRTHSLFKDDLKI